MNPVAADLHALFAFAALRLLDGFDRIQVRTASVRHYSMGLFRVTKMRNALVDEMPL
jgi:hypothetical protein